MLQMDVSSAPPENCNLAQQKLQRNFCTTLTNLQICATFAVTCNFCAISYAYVQFGIALLGWPINFDQLSMLKMGRLTSKLRLSMCLKPNSVKTNSYYSL